MTAKIKYYIAGAPVAIGKSVDDLQILLEETDKKTDAFILNTLKPYWRKEILPVYLAGTRLFIGLVIGFTLLDFRVASGLVIAPLFFLGALTYFAQHVFTPAHSVKSAGLKMLEVVADKILILPVAFYSLIVYSEALLFLIILLEIINATISLLASENGISLGQTIFTKSKTSLQYLVFMAIVATWPLAPNFIFIGLLWLSLLFMAISIIFKLIAIRMHYEASHSKDLQHAFREKGIIQAH